MPCGTHDAIHLQKSSLWKKLKSDELTSTPTCQVTGREVTPYLLGDSAYFLRPWLLKPFNKKWRGTKAQNEFDKKWRVGRVKIENAFDILKNKFRILRELNVFLPYAGYTIIACCALHNFCIGTGDVDNRDLRDDDNTKMTILKLKGQTLW